MPFKTIHPLYPIWQGMLGRCRNTKHPSWMDYGGRGISVCDRWKTFSNFALDMGDRPAKHSIERIDNDGNYEPNNCKWATKKEQQRNRRVVVNLMIEGKSYKAVELAEICGMKTDSVIARAKAGLTLDEVLNPKRRIFHEGLTLGGIHNGKRQSAKTHCPNGHEYNEKNTKITKEGWRNCKKCHADRERAKRHLLKQD